MWHLEDGLLRSLAKGRQHPPLALLVDDLGVHFDATQPSRMEQRIQQPPTLQHNRAREPQQRWCTQRLSKLNPARESPAPAEPFVLLVDQSAGDCSIGLGQAGPESFRRMLQEALRDQPDCLVVVKVHPDVIRGRARGHFRRRDLQHPRIRICADGLHPAALLEQAQAVYVVTSQMGFEALLWGRTVHCFGMPFYAGWGLTRDRLPARSVGADGALGSAGAFGAGGGHPLCGSPSPSALPDRNADGCHRAATPPAGGESSAGGGLWFHPLEATQPQALSGRQ